MSDTTCAQIILGREALDYVTYCLQNGKTLAKFLLDRRDLDQGIVSTFLPPAVPLDEINQFHRGGKFPTPPEAEWIRTRDSVIVPIPINDSHLVERVRRFLLAGRDSFCIMEDFNARPTDSCLRRRSTSFVTFRDEVYVFLSSASCGNGPIERALKETRSIPFSLGTLTSTPADGSIILGDKMDLTVGQLRALAERTEMLFVGAYDGEGYLIWDKPRSSRSKPTVDH